MDEVKPLKHLHEPAQIMWFDATEAGIIVIFYVIALVFDGFAWLLFLIGPYWFISEKRAGTRGFAIQLAYSQGLVSFKGYPNANANVFRE